MTQKWEKSKLGVILKRCPQRLIASVIGEEGFVVLLKIWRGSKSKAYKVSRTSYGDGPLAGGSSVIKEDGTGFPCTAPLGCIALLLGIKDRD